MLEIRKFVVYSYSKRALEHLEPVQAVAYLSFLTIVFAVQFDLSQISADDTLILAYLSIFHLHSWCLTAAQC